MPSYETNTVEAAAPEPEVPGTPIRPTARPLSVPPHARASSNPGSYRPYVNDQQNSRLTGDIPSAPLAIRWKEDLAPEFPAAFVLTAGDRIVTQSAGRWQLFDLNGKLAGAGRSGAGDLVMDAANGLLYSIDPYGLIEAHRLQDGGLAWSVSISGGEEWQRAFYARRNSQFAIVSFRRLLQPHAAADPSGVDIAVEELGNPLEIKHDIVVSARQKSRLYFEAPRASVVRSGDTLIAAIRNEVLITSFGETVRARLVDKFEAGPMSLDEAGRLYLLVTTASARMSLWALTGSGERFAAFEMPLDFAVVPAPPAIGYDHQIYLTSRSELMALSPDGRMLWRRPTQGRIAGIGLTPSDHMLVSEGSNLSAFDSRGERRLLYHFDADTLVTPPAITTGGNVVIASAKALYCLGPQGR